ncbi:hypothetical protein, partial [uncultured Parabacteroides sp.]
MYIRLFLIIAALLYPVLLPSFRAYASVIKITEEDIPLLKVDTSGDFITYLSPYYALSWAKDFPMMSY